MEELETIELIHKRSKRVSFWCGILIGVSVMFFVMTCIGFVVFQITLGDILAQKETDATSTDTAFTTTNVEKFKALEEAIDTYYYEENIAREDLINGAYKGMVESLGDPYSEYYTKKELDEIMEQINGSFYGIGVFVEKDKQSQYIRINSVISDSPSEEVGLHQGDLIYKVDDESTYGMELTAVVNLIKGLEGSTVHLTIIREGEEDYLEFDVERRKITSPTVQYEMLEDGIAYIQIIEFDEVTVDQFTEALAVVKESGMTSLILDLRSNPGGDLNAVVDIARMLLPEGRILYTKDRDGNEQEYLCDGKRELKVPMAVLVNGYSASAAEVLSGAIKDYNKGTLIGTTTFGKGIVQQIFSFKDGTAVKLTVSNYYLPKGKNIHGIGIEPDIVCEFDGEAYYSEERYDNQLERAKEFLKTGK